MSSTEFVVAAPLDEHGSVLELVPLLRHELRRDRDRVEGVEEEAACRSERARDIGEDAPVVLLSLEVAERGEDVDDAGKRGDVVELAHVAVHERELDAGLGGRRGGELERARAEVEPGHLEPAAGELDRDPSPPAGEIEDVGPRFEAELLDDESDLLPGNFWVLEREVVEPVPLEEGLVPPRIRRRH